MTYYRAVGAALAASTSAVALAHPGHGVVASSTLWHYLAEPLHWAWLVAALGAAWGLRQLRQARRDRGSAQ